MSDFERELERDLTRGVPGKPGAVVDARWLDEHELRTPDWRYKDDQERIAGILLGYRHGHVLGSIDDRHMLTVAGSRGGKGVSLIVPNLIKYDGSIIAIDPKGELARITARTRAQKGQKVVILDPFGENGRFASGSYNPLDALDPKSPSLADDAGLIADSLIVSNERDSHWTDNARILLKSLILYALDMPSEVRNLTTVRKLLMLSEPTVVNVAGRLEKSREHALLVLLSKAKGPGAEIISGGAEAIASMSDRERSGVFSTARTQTEFLDSGAMAEVLKRSDFQLPEIKTGKVTLYLCLPATRMATHARWLRVIINLALGAFERDKSKPAIPVLMLLDEFPVLGHMKAIETAAGLMAGFGVRLWVVIQDIGQMQKHYDKSWETFIGNAGVLTLWANTDYATLEYFSQKLGQTGVRLVQPSGASVAQKLSGASSTREELKVQRLQHPDELELLLARKHGRVLVKTAGQYPVILKRMVYWQDDGFAGQWDKHTL